MERSMMSEQSAQIHTETVLETDASDSGSQVYLLRTFIATTSLFPCDKNHFIIETCFL